MTSRLYGLCLMIVLICACGKERQKPIIEEEKMIHILTDLHIAHAAINKYPKDQRDSIAQVYRRQISEIYDVPEALIDSAIYILQSVPSSHFDMNFRIIQHLEAMGKKTVAEPTIDN